MGGDGRWRSTVTRDGTWWVLEEHGREGWGAGVTGAQEGGMEAVGDGRGQERIGCEGGLRS